MEPDTEKMEPDTEETGRKKRRMWDIRPYLAIGTTAVLVILICIIMFFVFLRFGAHSAGDPDRRCGCLRPEPGDDVF